MPFELSEVLELIKSPEVTSQIYRTLTLIGQLIRNWWWIPLPFALWKPFSFLWLWWRKEIWLGKKKFIMLEVRIPSEILKPIRAMETVMAGLWQSLWAGPNWHEKWWDGQVFLNYSFEIVSIGGEIHFYIVCPADKKDIAESIIFAQYPEVEISEVEDYTKNVPQDIPNKEWDLWGADYKLLRPDPYPIKTYKDFETESERMEEKRIDPLTVLLEAMAKVKPGEQLWVQVVAYPIGEEYVKPFQTAGLRIRDKLAKREEKPKKKSMFWEAFDLLVKGEVGVPKKETEMFPPEMRLTPGERDILAAVEEKISKLVFDTSIRFIFLGKRGVFYKANLRLVFGFFVSFFTAHLNGLVPFGTTITKVKKNWYDWFWFNKRRLYLRQRKLFRNYVGRDSPLWPRSGGTFMLNTEELATLFHFPSRAGSLAPQVSRIEAKKGASPPGLPVEE